MNPLLTLFLILPLQAATTSGVAVSYQVSVSPTPRSVSPVSGVVRPARADTVQITEWKVPWGGRPRDPYVAPDGRVWFCGQDGGYLAVFDPRTQEFKQYDLGEGAGPHNLIVDSRGFVWYAGNRRGHIGRLDPATGDVKIFPMPRTDARDPHTLVFDADENIWFTVQNSNYVGHLNTKTGDVKLMEVPTAGARPYGIFLDSHGTPWVALFGTYKLLRIDPETMTPTEVPLEREDARPRRLVITSDDNIWYVDYNKSFLGRYEPATGTFTEWPVPDGAVGRPYGMAVDEYDRIWFVDSGIGPNQFVGFDPKSETFISSTPIPSGGGTVRNMHYQRATATVWFGTDTNNLGKAVLPDPGIPKTDL